MFAEATASIRGEPARFQPEQIPVYDVIKRGAQAAMVVILQRDEAEWLQYAVCLLAHGAEDFGHAVHRPGLRLKGNFDEVTQRQTLGKLQQAARHGNGLEFSFGAAAVFETDRSQDRIA